LLDPPSARQSWAIARNKPRAELLSLQQSTINNQQSTINNQQSVARGARGLDEKIRDPSVTGSNSVGRLLLRATDEWIVRIVDDWFDFKEVIEH
jgi:hypothetical protein